MVLFYLMLIFMLIAALIAVETKDLLSSVICIGAIGFGASLMFLFLRAPDIARTEIVVEVLGLILLIRATIDRDHTFISGQREFYGTVVSVVVVLVILLAGIEIMKALPAFGTPVFTQTAGAASRTYLAEGLAKTGAPNIVSSIILDFRAYDTLGEVTVLFTAIMGVTVILRKQARKKLEDPDV